MGIFKQFIVLSVLFSGGTAFASTFNWENEGWNDGDLSKSFSNVDGSGVDITVNVTGNTNRFEGGWNPSPSVKDDLQQHIGHKAFSTSVNFENTSESITVSIHFSQAVILRGLKWRDIDWTHYSNTVGYDDKIIVVAQDASGNAVSLVNVVTGQNIESNGPDEYESDGTLNNTTPDDPNAVVTADVNTPVTDLSYTYTPGDDSISNPSGQHIWFDNFVFSLPTNKDFGDAPDGITVEGITRNYGDASHQLGANAYIRPTAPDLETGSQGNANADSDDSNEIGDEGGIVFYTMPGNSATIYADVDTHNPSNGAIRICAWMDVNVDGAFSTGGTEAKCAQVAPGDKTKTFSWTGFPTDKAYTTYARFRISADVTLNKSDFSGQVTGGEVEDYRVKFNFSPTVVSIGSVELRAEVVADLFHSLDLANMSDAQLQALLRAWAPDIVQDGRQLSRRQLLEELRAWLDPDGDGRVATVRWETLEERGTIGFYAERRTADGEWKRVNSGLLPGLITAPQGGEYLLADPRAEAGVPYQYRLIEQEARGSQKTYGPYSLKY